MAEYDYPVVYGFPAGHIPNNYPLIFGREVTLNVTEKWNSPSRHERSELAAGEGTGGGREKIACEHLRSKGHTILNRRYRYDRAEVDIVSESGGMLVFTEVKTRESSYLTEPIQLVPLKKQRQLIKAADGYLKERNEER